jgi:hypothetical protein
VSQGRNKKAVGMMHGGVISCWVNKWRITIAGGKKTSSKAPFSLFPFSALESHQSPSPVFSFFSYELHEGAVVRLGKEGDLRFLFIVALVTSHRWNGRVEQK